MALFIGYGKLTKSLVELLDDRKITIFSRTKEKVLEGIKEHSHIQWRSPNSFHKEREVWLLLPNDQVRPFLEKYDRFFHEETIFYFCATKGRLGDYEHLLSEKQKMIPVKFITEARQLKKDKKGLAAIPYHCSDYEVTLQKWFGKRIEVVFAEEEQVFFINQTATRKAIELMEEMRYELVNQGISQKLIDHAGLQIVPGVIRSYLEDQLGGFGKQVVEEMNRKREGHENG
ncbi:hypothetical protein LGQ02_16040 [Bacillus shivajii]|uniref:hypothetical protein n=1 Tax=Bacillus shivajii TaxID=1983719 RepID=UPI001CF9EB01|nr:hypothetical protein [Bacillus shivajii]UCZ52340.1 hypothetical protein LGQ02_16040 [Bacillus shivajii]